MNAGIFAVILGFSIEILITDEQAKMLHLLPTGKA
jgi:hypothetical protein